MSPSTLLISPSEPGAEAHGIDVLPFRRPASPTPAGTPTVGLVEPTLRPALNARMHVSRSVARVLALLAVDVGALASLRAFLHLARETPSLGEPVRAVIQAHLPAGFLNTQHFAVGLFAGLVLTGAYGAGDRRAAVHRLVGAAGVAAALELWPLLWSRAAVGAGQFVAVVLAISAVLSAGRLVLDTLLRHYRPHAAARTVLVGPGAACHGWWSRLDEAEARGLALLGHVPLDEEADGVPVLGQLGGLYQTLLRTRADTVLLCGHQSDAELQEIVKAATMAECQLLSTSRAFEAAGLQPQIVWRRGRAMMALRPMALRYQQLLLKRLLDVVVSAALLALAAPVMLVLAVLVRLTSRGPAVFGQRRLGRYGYPFRCYKFRSMHVDAETRLHDGSALYAEYLHNDFKLPADRDPRITPLGRVLRRTSLDELPQLWNVLKGDMSLVGPRPIVQDEIRHYRAEAPLLLVLKPGLTGEWQVSGRSALPYPERTFVELEYVQRWSLLGDVGILLRTAPAVLRQRGAH